MRKLIFLTLLIFLCFCLGSLAVYGDAKDSNNEDSNKPVKVEHTQNIDPQKSDAAPYESMAKQGPPAWSNDGKYIYDSNLEPFGSNLFNGNFSTSYYSGMDESYQVMPGDRVMVRVWGAKTFDEILPVDQQGNLFLPEIGPIQVAGLTQKELLGKVKSKISTVFTSNVDIYVNLMNSQPVAVYVTGFVAKPGRYAGGPTDSIIYFLDLAGGVDPYQGSFRNIKITRNNETLTNVDLYEFILKGQLANLRLQNGDTIVVGKKGPTVAATGRLRQPAWYELAGSKGLSGSALLNLTTPLNGVSHVSLSGVRNDAPYHIYMTIEEFKTMQLADGDQVEFHSDRRSDSIMVAVSGAADGGSRFTVQKGTSLLQLLPYVPIDPDLADWKSVYVKRKSVAEQQRQSIHEALKRLEQSSLTATSESVDEAQIRVKEAELVQNFVSRAKDVTPNGVVVVSRRGKVMDMPLEDGDTIVVPLKTNVVIVAGEVMMPNSVVYSADLKLADYIDGAGGYTDRADTDNILAVKPNGEVGMAKKLGISPGDKLLVMAAYDGKGMQRVKDVAQIIYQIAVATGVLIGL